jgi:hypothetical protein
MVSPDGEREKDWKKKICFSHLVFFSQDHRIQLKHRLLHGSSAKTQFTRNLLVLPKSVSKNASRDDGDDNAADTSDSSNDNNNPDSSVYFVQTDNPDLYLTLVYTSCQEMYLAFMSFSAAANDNSTTLPDQSQHQQSQDQQQSESVKTPKLYQEFQIYRSKRDTNKSSKAASLFNVRAKGTNVWLRKQQIRSLKSSRDPSSPTTTSTTSSTTPLIPDLAVIFIACINQSDDILDVSFDIVMVISESLFAVATTDVSKAKSPLFISMSTKSNRNVVSKTDKNAMDDDWRTFRLGLIVTVAIILLFFGIYYSRRRYAKYRENQAQPRIVSL